MSEIDLEIPQNDEEVDALIESVSGSEQSPTEGQAPAPTIQAAQEYEIKYGGKQIKAPIEKILRWAEQGYDAPTKIGDLNKKLQEWTTKEKTLKELEGKYSSVDNYVRENPQWWEYIQNQFDQQQNRSQTDPMAHQLGPLQQQMQDLMKFKDSIEQERSQEKVKQEDTAYREEFGKLKQQYPKVDFSSVDETGKSLEYRVLEHAIENGIKKFTTAFRDFYHDDLLKMKEVETKEGFAKNKLSNSKLGILGISSTPTPRKSDSVKGKSYDDLAKEALSEFGLS